MPVDKLHPQLRKAMGRIPAVPFHNPLLRPVLAFLSKRKRKAMSLPGVEISDRKLKHTGVRIYRPEGACSGAGLLWIHGGGLIIGAPAMNDRECAQYARELKLVVVSTGYRLAPRHPFPAALDDCFEAWQWLQQNAPELGITRNRVVISGQSAGGGLAASLVQRIHDTGGVQPAGQALFYPMLDDRTAARRELDSPRNILWNNRSNRAAWGWYLGQAPGAATLSPYAAAARRADLRGLPPAWIGVGEIDLFCEEDSAYAARLAQAGVPCRIEVVPGAPHAFDVIATDTALSRDFVESNYRFLRETLRL